MRPMYQRKRAEGKGGRTLQGLAEFAIVHSSLSAAAEWGLDELNALRRLFQHRPLASIRTRPHHEPPGPDHFSQPSQAEMATRKGLPLSDRCDLSIMRLLSRYAAALRRSVDRPEDRIPKRDVTIVSYLAELKKALTGPRGLKKDLLAEARCSLEDAAEDYRAQGLTPADAAELAVADFGTTREVAPGYQRELAVAQSGRTAWWLLIFVALQFIQSKRSWKSTGAWEGHRPSGGYLLFSHVWTWSQIIVVVAAAVTAVGFRGGVRYIAMPWRLTPLVGGLTLLILGVRLVMSAVFIIATPHLASGIMEHARSPRDLLIALPFLLVLWMLPDVYIGLSAIRCMTSADKCGSEFAVV